MKIPNNIPVPFICAAVLLMSTSCGTRVADADYPSQRLYLPAAVESTVYIVDQVEISTGNTPTEGSPYQFVLDISERTLTIPLSVYRAGVDNDGDVHVDIWLDGEPVYDAILAGDLGEDVRIMPTDLCECPSRVNIEDGSSSAMFYVECMLDYLLDSPQRDRYVAFGVSIGSHDREVNSECSSVAIVIDTAIFEELGL